MAIHQEEGARHPRLSRHPRDFGSSGRAGLSAAWLGVVALLSSSEPTGVNVNV